MAADANSLPLAWGMFRAGERVAVAVSGGADSVALLRALHQASATQGLVLRVVHINHNLRGQESDGDEQFVRLLADRLSIACDVHSVDTLARVRELGESVEQAARELRYEVFRQMLTHGLAESVATAHTLDDQAETVLLKWLRGAWTEGLGGISPLLPQPVGRVVRPMLSLHRSQVEQYLHSLGQPWRQDSSNHSPDFTRNRVRHELLPLLRTFNPGMAEQLCRVAEIARDEEQHWQAELQRALPSVLLAGKPVRGGGRSVGPGAASSVALDAVRLNLMDAAVQRRVLRAAALQLGFRLQFDQVALLLDLLGQRGGSKASIANLLQAERTPRELRLSVQQARSQPAQATGPQPLVCTLPGVTFATGFGLRVEASLPAGAAGGGPAEAAQPQSELLLRVWRPGDRVRLRHTLSDAKVKEVLQRKNIPPQQKAVWPVLLWHNQVVWMQGFDVQPPADAPAVAVAPLAEDWHQSGNSPQH